MQHSNVTLLRFNVPRGRTSGIGQATDRSAISAVSITGKAGDVVYLSLIDILDNASMDTPLHFQAAGGDAKVSFTLVDAARATNRRQAVQDAVPWGNETVVSGNDIVVAPIINCTAIKVQFDSDAELYINGR